MVEGEWITMATVGNFGGATFVVTLVVQFLKGTLDRLLRLPTRVFALGVSWLVLLGHRYVATGAMPLEGLYLDLLNGFLVALAAMGTHAVARDNLNWK